MSRVRAWAAVGRLVASGGTLDSPGPFHATTHNTTHTPPNGGSVAVAREASIWTGRAPCSRSEQYHWHFLVWAGAVTLVASGGALDKTGPHDATTRNTTRTPPNGGSVAVASGARFGQAVPHAADQSSITGTPLPMHLGRAQRMGVALA